MTGVVGSSPGRARQKPGLPEPYENFEAMLDDDRVLLAAGCPRSERLLRSTGLEPVVVDISEFEKLEGCVTCLSVRLREAPAT